ncbi:cytochrome P450 [Pholiota conissans]|uniref:Cytochrome P450 n=1 Tax=Pholiota conissans TaxID=109636 RepID=A0A9P5YVQ5_9AGAR|nr:cytochrome P450 [Pholiota conissans]
MSPTLSSSDSAISKHHADILTRLPYLNAVINECLRLYPPVPTGLQRAPAKGSKGKLLKGNDSNIYLPEGNAISMPPYVIHRDPHYFSPHPDEFIPDRWLSSETHDTSKTLSHDPFIPFSYGPQNLVRNFTMKFDTSSFDPNLWEKQFQDRFTFAKGRVDLLVGLRDAKLLGTGSRT